MENNKFWSKSGIIVGAVFIIVNIGLSTMAYNDPAISHPTGFSDLKAFAYPNILLGLPAIFLSEILRIGKNLFIDFFIILSIYWFLIGVSLIWIYNILPKIGKIFFVIILALICVITAYLIIATFTNKFSTRSYSPQSTFKIVNQ